MLLISTKIFQGKSPSRIALLGAAGKINLGLVLIECSAGSTNNCLKIEFCVNYQNWDIFPGLSKKIK